MGFIINLTIALILFTVEAMKVDDDRETVRCKAKAYLTLYFFLVSIFGKTINYLLIIALRLSTVG